MEDSQHWYRLGEWSHCKLRHTGQEALFFAAQSRGWPITRKICKDILTQCPQCQLRLGQNHPDQALPLHIRSNKTLCSTWQIDYIGPLKTSKGYKYILTGVEVISRLLRATKSRQANVETTISWLSDWFSSLPVPDSIQSHNFTSVVVHDWARKEGIKWIFHTPYYPQANGIVERANGLLKRYLKPQKPGWDKRLTFALYQINNRYGLMDSLVSQTFLCPMYFETTPNNTTETFQSNFIVGQPVTVKLPVGQPGLNYLRLELCL